jgi:hypothetical protein
MTSASVVTGITFAKEFATGKVPNVFPMTPEFGTGAADSPCAIRIRDNDNVGFDAVCLEAVHEVRDSPAVNFNDIAMQSGTLNIPIVASVTTVRLESGCNTISNHQFGTKCNNCLLAPGAIQSYGAQAFLSPTFTNPPVFF